MRRKRCLGLRESLNVIYENFMIREVPTKKSRRIAVQICNLSRKIIEDVQIRQSEQGNHEECENLQSEAENREKQALF